MLKNDASDFIALIETDGQTSYFIQLGKDQVHHIVESDGHEKTLCGIRLDSPEAKVIPSKELYIEFTCHKCVKKVNKKIGTVETAS